MTDSDPRARSDEVENLATRVAELDALFAALRDQVTDRAERESTLEARLAEAQTSLAKLAEVNERLVAALKEARFQIVALKEEVDRLTQPSAVAETPSVGPGVGLDPGDVSPAPAAGREGGGLDQFNDQFRRVVATAKQETQRFHHRYLGTEHILLGLLQADGTVAAEALDSLGISVGAVRDRIEELVGTGQEDPSGQIPFTSRAKTVLALSVREARLLTHDYVGPEHLLLGLIREGKGVAVKVIAGLGVDLTRLREQVVGLLPHGTRPQVPADLPPVEPPPGVRPADAHVGVVFADAALPLSGELASAQTYVHRASQRPKDDVAGRISDFTDAIRLEPDYADAYRRRGIDRLSQDDRQGALTDFDEAIRVEPDHAVTRTQRGLLRHILGDRSGAVADFDEAIRLDGPSAAAALTGRGDVREELGDRDRALADFDSAIRLDPSYAEAFRSRGSVRVDLGDYHGAVADFDQAIRSDPWKASTFLRRALAHSQTGDPQAAIADCDQAIRLNPLLAPAFLVRSVVEWSIGEWDRGIRDMEEACRLSPENTEYAGRLVAYRSERGSG